MGEQGPDRPIARLWAHVADQPPRSAEVVDERLLVGRGDHCDLVLDDPTVSWDHLELTRSGQTLLARDLHSSNGTLLNGRRLDAQARLHDGDTLTLGVVRVVVSLAVPARDATRPVQRAPVVLTGDERDVARALVRQFRQPGQLAARPATRAEIAEELHLSERTVQRRLDGLAIKLRVSSQTGRDRPLEIARRVLELGLDAAA